MCLLSIYFHSSGVDTLTTLSDTLISFDTSSTRYWKKKKMKAAESNMKKKIDSHVSASSLNSHLIITVYFLSSFKDDEPVLAKEEGDSADVNATEDR